MSAEVGQFALILALLLALVQSAAPLFGAQRGDGVLMAVGRQAAILQGLFVVTDSDSEFQEALAYLPTELRLETTRLYADYLHSFEINGKG